MFEELIVIDDPTPRSGPLNMAIDEVLVKRSQSAILRFYCWNAPSVSFGYFVKFGEANDLVGDRATVRRWTGGGIVLHGDDLTYSIIIPPSDQVFTESSKSIYENVHQALCRALIAQGDTAELVTVAALHERRNEMDPAVISQIRRGEDRRYHYCFLNPVRADVMVNGQKIAGAAHRKTRNGLLHQGSIQRANLDERFRNVFAKLLGGKIAPASIGTDMLSAAEDLAATKYATTAWLKRR